MSSVLASVLAAFMIFNPTTIMQLAIYFFIFFQFLFCRNIFCYDKYIRCKDKLLNDLITSQTILHTKSQVRTICTALPLVPRPIWLMIHRIEVYTENTAAHFTDVTFTHLWDMFSLFCYSDLRLINAYSFIHAMLRWWSGFKSSGCTYFEWRQTLSLDC